MTTWVPVIKPAVAVVGTVPTADLVRRCGLGRCPGLRLSKDGLALVDSEGFFTRFYCGTGGIAYAHIIDPRGHAMWLQEVRTSLDSGPEIPWDGESSVLLPDDCDE